MNELKCVIKTLKDQEDNIVWEALYIDGRKQLEDINLDKESANKLFNKNNQYKNVVLTEYDIDDNLIKDNFPECENFIDLLDYKNIEVGSEIFLEDGIYTIKDIKDEYRISGYYNLFIWTKIDQKYYYNVDKTFYSGHVATKLILNDNREIFWEDYNYHQSFLYLKLRQDGLV